MSEEELVPLVEVDHFCHSLLAYVFQYYKDSQTCELAAGLPIQKDFAIPEDFDKVLGDSQIYVNKALRPYFRPVFDKAVVYACRTEESFKKFVSNRILKTSFTCPEVAILTACAIVSELNLYCFQRDCFRFASYAPCCLYTLFRKSPSIMSYLSNESEGTSSDFRRGFKKLRTYCVDMLDLQKNDSGYIPGLFDGVGKRFKKIKDKAIDFRIPMTSTMSTLPEGEEDDEEETAPLVDPNQPPPSPEECSYCREKNCSRYIQQFERELEERLGDSV